MTTQQQYELPAPRWAVRVTDEYKAGLFHCFVLYGNVEDYVGGATGLFLRNYLIQLFEQRDLIVSWNYGTGLVLPTTEQEQLFEAVVNFPKPGAATTGLAGALNAATAGANLPLTDRLKMTRKPGDAIEYINRMMRSKRRVKNVVDAQTGRTRQQAMKYTAIVDYAEAAMPRSESADRALPVVLAELARDEQIGANGHILIMITNDLNGLSEPLLKSGARFEQIEVPYPTAEEREAYFQRIVSQQKNVRLADGVTFAELARLTTGMRFIDIKDICLQAAFDRVLLSSEVVKARKDAILKNEYNQVLSIVEPTYGFEQIGGLAEVKAHLVKTIIKPMREGKVKRVPSGLLFMGPAGTGKTLLARALAKEAGFTFIELALDKVHSMWHGKSQRNFAKVIEAMKNNFPCIVLIDEIDQKMRRGEADGSGSNDAYNYIFAQTLELMGDRTMRGKILWIGCTNRPDIIDDALIRPGRLSMKIPILTTDDSDRAKVLRVIVDEQFADEEGVEMPSNEQYEELAAHMSGYTGAEIGGLAEKAYYLLDEAQGSVYEALKAAFDRILTTTRGIDRMTRLAIENCNDLDILPRQFHDLARQLHNKQSLDQPVANEAPLDEADILSPREL
jgi:transitional endoplasmic reticulum ATPase